MTKLSDPKLATPGSAEERLLHQLDPRRIPRHVAVIMDGNGRWARQRRRPRVAGHRAGLQSVRETVEVAARLGIEMRDDALPAPGAMHGAMNEYEVGHGRHSCQARAVPGAFQ